MGGEAAPVTGGPVPVVTLEPSAGVPDFVHPSTDCYFYEKAFPNLFPYGVGGPGDLRSRVLPGNDNCPFNADTADVASPDGLLPGEDEVGILEPCFPARVQSLRVNVHSPVYRSLFEWPSCVCV
jgi:hypothetical protein